MSKAQSTLSIIFKGLAIGIGNIIPGVSGGTVAVILGIYEMLISSLGRLFSVESLKMLKEFLLRKPLSNPEHWQENKSLMIFLIKLVLGALLGIFLFSQLISIGLKEYPQPTMFFFMGLIMGSLPALYKAHPSFKWSMSHAVGGALGVFLMVMLSLVPESAEAQVAAMKSIGFSDGLFLIFSGAIAAGTMVIPGISGSLMLLIMGSYYTVLNAVSTVNLPILTYVAIGAGLGIVTFTKLINLFLKRYPIFSAYFIMGLVVGSLVKLYPGLSLDMMGGISIFATTRKMKWWKCNFTGKSHKHL